MNSAPTVALSAPPRSHRMRLSARLHPSSVFLLALGLTAAASTLRADCFPDPVAELTAPPAESVLIASPLALHGSRIAIGAPNHDDPIHRSGAVRILEFDGSSWVETAIVLNPAPFSGAAFGTTVALNGDVLMVTRPHQSSPVALPPVVYVFTWDGSSWNWTQTLDAPDPQASIEFGYAIAMDSLTAMIADRFISTAGTSQPRGAVVVYDQSSGVWIPSQTLIPIQGALPGGAFGEAIALSGDHAVIGAPLHQNPSPSGNDPLLMGAAYFYERVLGLWTETTYFADPSGGSRLGQAVAISGNRALVASEFYGETGSFDDASGALYAFSWGGGGWSLDGILPAPAGTGQRYGRGVAMQGDRAIATSLIGVSATAPLSLHELRFETSSWIRKRSGPVLTTDFLGSTDLLSRGPRAAFGADGTVLLASASSAVTVFQIDDWPLEEQPSLQGSHTNNGNMGSAIATDGSRAVIGASQDPTKGTGAGAAYVYRRQNGVWISEGKLLMSDGAVGDQAGFTVGISGDVVVVGAYGEDERASGAGAAYVFEWNGSSWVEVQKLMASDGAANDEFGYGVAISGDRIVVGSPRHDLPISGCGAAYVYERIAGVWTEAAKLTEPTASVNDFLGWSVAIDGDRIVAGAPYASGVESQQGSASVFRFDGSSWMPETELQPWIVTNADHMGEAVAICGDRIVAGMKGGSSGPVTTGVAFVYAWDGGDWTGMARLTPDDAESGDSFGNAVAIRGDKLLVGMVGDDDVAYGSGAAYVYLETPQGWRKVSKLVASDGQYLARFGTAVALGDDYALVGAPTHNIPGTGGNHGVVYPYEVECDEAVTVGVPADPPSFKAMSLSLFPNPIHAGRMLFIRSGAHPASGMLEAFDVAGRRVRTWRVESPGPAGDLRLDVSGLPSGTYLLRFASETGRIAARFAIVR